MIVRIVIGVVFAAVLASGQPVRVVDDAALRNAGKSGEEWLTYGHTAGETRYSALRQIDTGNVSRLSLAWSHEIGGGGGGQEATPLVWNGTIYGITNWGVVNRGLAIYQGMIIAPVIDGRLQALNAETGKVIWEARVAFPQDEYTITMACLLYTSDAADDLL